MFSVWILSCRHAHNSPMKERVPRRGKQKSIYLLCPFIPNPDKQRSKMTFLPNNLIRTSSSLTKQDSGNSPVFQAAPAPQHKRCSTTTKYAGIKEFIPVLFFSWGTLSPITEKLAAPVCRAVCTAREGASLPRGLLPVNREWHFVECAWGGPVTLLCCQSLLQAIILSKVISALCLSLVGRCSLFFIKLTHWWNDKWVSRNRNIQLDELF